MNALFPSLLASLVGSLCFLGAGCPSRLPSSDLSPPLDHIETRDKKLTFGLYVTPDPKQNPIDPPERFTGYHTALDIEILPEEKEKDVPVYAICTGTIAYRENNIDGYGGVTLQNCSIEQQPVTVLYGHVDPSSFTHAVGEHVTGGTRLGYLGDHKSAETSYTRKHLHLSIHKGTDLELRGYVPSKEELSAYIDPQPLLERAQ